MQVQMGSGGHDQKAQVTKAPIFNIILHLSTKALRSKSSQLMNERLLLLSITVIKAVCTKKNIRDPSMAAAYGALLSLFNNLDLIQTHPLHSFSFHIKQIESLVENVTFLIDFMESNQPAEDLERQIARAAHAAVDAIESNVVDQIRAGNTRAGEKSSNFLLDLHSVNEEMDFVKRKAIKAKKGHSGKEAERLTYSSTSPTFNKRSMVGFEDVSYKLMDQLIGEPASRRVIPIVGMGGIGKTTLAENTFQLKSVVQHFDVRRWVSISQEYSVKEILLQLLSRQGMSTNETADELGEQLHKKLWGRRYLIVLDDVWDVKAWDKIQLYLPNDSISQSRIILTTRLQKVADCFGSASIVVDFLDDDKSWLLFCEKAFAEQGCPPELEDIGKKIVKKCKGLPLAIIVLAGHLGKSSMTEEYWENIADHMNSVLDSGENEEQVFKILHLSYSHMPIHLKPCFLYMGTHPSNASIFVSEIIKLWIAEGFLKPKIAQSLEEIGKGYLNDLISRNLTLVPGQNLIVGGDGSFKVHDVLRELCLKIDEKEKFFQVLHASKKKINHFKLARVVEDKVDRALTNEVGGDFLEAHFQQINLRYLECLKVDRKYKSLPPLYLSSSISLLWNLQTIIIRGAYPLVIAPYEIWEMVQLRQLVFRQIHLPDPLPNDRSVLQNLCILRRVENLKLSEEVCKRIPNIKDLNLIYRSFKKECDEPVSHYCPYNLSCLHKLKSLYCTFSADPEWRQFALSLAFPSSLKELSLCDSRFQWEELTQMVGSLPHLEILSLYSNSVIGSEWSPVHGKFLRLKSLTIDRCDDLIYWNAESSHFPVLEEVVLEELTKLDEFPSSVGDIPSFRRIALRRCSVSSAVSALRMLMEQEDYGNDGIQLEVAFSGDDDNILSFWEKMEEDDLRSDNLVIVPLT